MAKVRCSGLVAKPLRAGAAPSCEAVTASVRRGAAFLEVKQRVSGGQSIALGQNTFFEHVDVLIIQAGQSVDTCRNLVTSPYLGKSSTAEQHFLQSILAEREDTF